MTVIAASIAPEAPSACPYRPLVPDTGTLRGVLAQRQVQRLRLRQLVQLRGGGMRVDVADLLRRQRGIGQGGGDRRRRGLA